MMNTGSEKYKRYVCIVTICGTVRGAGMGVPVDPARFQFDQHISRTLIVVAILNECSNSLPAIFTLKFIAGHCFCHSVELLYKKCAFVAHFLCVNFFLFQKFSV